MQIMTDAMLLERIERFLAQTEMSASRFGINAIGDGALVFQLRAGNRSPTLKMAARLIAYMEEYRAPAAERAA